MNLKIHSDLVEAVVALKNNPPEQERKDEFLKAEFQSAYLNVSFW